MSKREDAYELFDQGKGVDDPEMLALGLAPETLQKYHRDWKRLSREGTATVEVSSLEPGQSFSLAGETYIVSAVYPFGVMAVPPEPTSERKLVERLSPDTLVKPTEE